MYNKLYPLYEGLGAGDLARVVDPNLTIDEFKSKMGNDEDIIVLSFEVKYKEPALDMVNFIEKGYAWVADADVSSGELDNGSYMIFIEAERTPDIIDNICELFEDLERLTKLKVEDWNVTYYKPERSATMSKESLKEIIPTTPEAYRNMMRKYKTKLDQLKTAAGINVDTIAPKNDYTESIRIAAGLK